MEDSKKEVAELNEKPQDDVIEDKTDDEIRESIIEKFGLNEDENSELIEKLVSHEVESNKKLSTAVRQKIGWREKFNAVKSVETTVKTETKQDKVEISDDLIQKKIDETMEKRELESLEVSDTLKTEIKNYAKLNGVSVKQARNSSYIKFLENEEARKSTAEDASISTTHKSKTMKNFDNVSPKDFDLSTEEGRKDFADYKKYLSSQK
jgi:acyl-CoA-binding protein